MGFTFDPALRAPKGYLESRSFGALSALTEGDAREGADVVAATPRDQLVAGLALSPSVSALNEAAELRQPEPLTGVARRPVSLPGSRTYTAASLNALTEGDHIGSGNLGCHPGDLEATRGTASFAPSVSASDHVAASPGIAPHGLQVPRAGRAQSVGAHRPPSAPTGDSRGGGSGGTHDLAALHAVRARP